MTTILLPLGVAYGCYRFLFGKYDDDNTGTKPVNTVEMLVKITFGIPLGIMCTYNAFNYGAFIDAFLLILFMSRT